jgi:hypothetical protein
MSDFVIAMKREKASVDHKFITEEQQTSHEKTVTKGRYNLLKPA